MVKIYGKVTSGPEPFQQISIILPECIQRCYNSSECILASFLADECALYTYKSWNPSLVITEVGPDAESYVAVKTILPENLCPVSYRDINFIFIDEFGKRYPWTRMLYEWTFNFCIEGWKRLDRPTLSVCMKATALTYGATKEEAVTSCQSMDAKLIGAQSDFEVAMMSIEIRNLFPDEQTFFWIDGERVGNDLYNFTYSDGMTSGNEALIATKLDGNKERTPESCLNIYFKKYNGDYYSIKDVYCTGASNASGAICGYRLE